MAQIVLEPFQWGGNQAKTAADLARQQKVIDALLAQTNKLPTDFWSGANSLVAQGVGNVLQGREDTAMNEGRDKYASEFSALGDNPDRAKLMDLAGNDFGNDGQSAVVKALLAQNIDNSDPAHALDLKIKQAQLDAAGKPSMGDAPSAYRWTSDGQSLEPIPGGPSDPTTTQMLSPDALDLVATQFLAGDKSAAVGYARNAALKTQITNAIAAKAKEMGMDGRAVAAQISAFGGNVAAQRSAGTRAAQVGMAASEANQMADIALDASKAVPRDTLVPWNSIVQAVQKGTSSPEMAQFVTATTSLVNAYARAISPLGAPTDAMRAHAEEMLNTAQGPEAYAAVIAQMKKEMEAALNAPAEISDRLKTSITGKDQPEDVGKPVPGFADTFIKALP